MTTFDLENPDPLPGDRLRDLAANLLSVRYGRPIREALIEGKKVDLLFSRKEFNKTRTLFVEAKDHGRNLTRNDLVHIWEDYSPLVAKSLPATLLVVTSRGLAPAAEAYVASHPQLDHQTIWQLENDVFGLTEYVRHLAGLFEEDGLSRYYVPGRARAILYDGDHRHLGDVAEPLFETVQTWIASEDRRPVAILGGYGAGKSSFAKQIISAQAAAALADPLARRPVLIRLGEMARSSSLEGLLGAKFTSEFPIDGFNVSAFLQLSDRGRLLTVLDGFDEMKHAMTWADFRVQIQSLNRLTHGLAKVILLGRPAAFTSTDEHFHVLRGLKWNVDSYRKLPDWPEFSEYEIEPFSPKDRERFVIDYLSMLDERSSTPLGADRIAARASEVNRIADREPEIFSKPVHARIFTDLASDPSVDLGKFAHGVSRWTLYKTFFSSLAEREAEKASRRPIPETERLRFLRELALWLWSKKGGATAFHAPEIPDELLGLTPSSDAADFDAVRREYLTGAFLEKKADDVYFFAHRSFAEFLVAQHLSLHPPKANEHSAYSELVRDGVEVFLAECPDKEGLRSWASTLSTAGGLIHIGYLHFLSAQVGGSAALLGYLAPGSPISVIVSALGHDLSLGLERRPALKAAMRDARDAVFFPALELLQIIVAETNVWTASQLGAEVAAALLDRLFVTAELDEATGKARIAGGYEAARRLAHQALSELDNRAGDRRMNIIAERLYRLHSDYVRSGGLEVLPRGLNALRTARSDADFPWSEVLKRVDKANHDKIVKYYRRQKSLGGVFVAQIQKA